MSTTPIDPTILAESAILEADLNFQAASKSSILSSHNPLFYFCLNLRIISLPQPTKHELTRFSRTSQPPSCSAALVVPPPPSCLGCVGSSHCRASYATSTSTTTTTISPRRCRRHNHHQHHQFSPWRLVPRLYPLPQLRRRPTVEGQRPRTL